MAAHVFSGRGLVMFGFKFPASGSLPVILSSLGYLPEGIVPVLFEFTVKSLLLHPQRTLDLEYQDGGDDYKILLCMRDPVLYRSMNEAQ